MGFLSDKPYTAVTATIDRLTSQNYAEDDVAEIVELVEVIGIQSTGPTEAARAIRKKLKYGTAHEQLRALVLLDALVQNGGKSLTPLYCDEYLLERLRLLVTDQSTPKKVKVRAQGMFAVWAQDLRGRRECERLVALYKQVPRRVRKPRPQPKYLSNDPRDLEEDYGDEEEERDARRRGETYDRYGNDDSYDDDNDRSHGSSSSSSRAPPIPPSSSKPKHVSHSSSHHSRSSQPAVRKINLTTERPKIQKVLAESGSAATNLSNALKLINWEKELSTQNATATECFNKCRALRKHVLRYIHSIESEEFIGPLIHANDELVSALQQYDEMSRPADYDSDSDGSADSDYENDDWKVESDRVARMNINEEGEGRSSGGGDYSKGKSRRHAEEDEEDPFGDSHAI